jgi:hypothetical protein
VDAHDPAHDLDGKINVAGGAKGNQCVGTGGIEAKGDGHLEDQDFHGFVVGNPQQFPGWFFCRMNADLIVLNPGLD